MYAWNNAGAEPLILTRSVHRVQRINSLIYLSASGEENNTRTTYNVQCEVQLVTRKQKVTPTALR